MDRVEQKLAEHQRRKAEKVAVREAFAERRNAGLVQRHRSRLERAQALTPVEVPTSPSQDVTGALKGQRRWAADEIEKLTRLKAEGLTAEEIGLLLGRSRFAVYQRSHILKRAGRDAYRCSRCQRTLPAEVFRVSMRFDSGYCKPCMAEYQSNRRRMAE